MCESRSLIDDSRLLNTAHDQDDHDDHDDHDEHDDHDDHDDDHSIFLNIPTATSATYGISTRVKVLKLF